MLFIFGLFVISCPWHVLGDAAWNYEDKGPSTWSSSYSVCGGQSQSPIDIKTSAVIDNYNHQMIDLSKSYSSLVTGNLKNNGHTAVFSLTGADILTASKGGLTSTYQLAQFHFHWGEDLKHGSEHALYDKYFPGEIHFVHFKTQYADSTGALASNTKDALAVLGFLVEISSSDNPSFKPIIDALANLKKYGQNTTVTGLNVRSLLPTMLGNFYRYDGSLTTPGCQEAVVWTVFKDTIKLSASQLDQFRKLSSDHGSIKENFRPPQPLNSRKVTYAIFNSATSAAVNWLLIGAILGFTSSTA